MPTFLAGIWGYVIGGVAIAAVAAFGSYKVTAAFKDHDIDTLKLEHAQDVAKRQAEYNADLIKRIKITQDADAAYAKAHPIIVTQTRVIHDVITKYLPAKVDAQFPVPCGLIRLWDARVLATTPDQLPYPTGYADDTACPIKASALADAGTALVGLYYEVADELKALQLWNKNQELANHPTSP